jgi:hypothetical protein
LDEDEFEEERESSGSPVDKDQDWVPGDYSDDNDSENSQKQRRNTGKRSGKKSNTKSKQRPTPNKRHPGPAASTAGPAAKKRVKAADPNGANCLLTRAPEPAIGLQFCHVVQRSADSDTVCFA